MLGSGFEAEDAVQETMVRAWRNLDRFEGRSALRSWLYRIATNVCLDMLKGPQRRARPMDLGPSSTADSQLRRAASASTRGCSPSPTRGWSPPTATRRRSPRRVSRSASPSSPRCSSCRRSSGPCSILREVLHWHADEVAELLDTSVASVNSALQRARATIADSDVREGSTAEIDDAQRELLARYVAAFEAYDMEALVALIHEDATFSMPPFDLWLSDPVEMGKWYTGQGAACEGSKLFATEYNGSPAFWAYKPDPVTGGWIPFSLQIVEVADGKLIGLHHFLYPELFAAGGMPDHLDA